MADFPAALSAAPQAYYLGERAHGSLRPHRTTVRPHYWDPPSLFDLAQCTGFDLESLVFGFAIVGVGAALYDIVTRRTPVRMTSTAHAGRCHRYHRLALLTPVMVFPVLYFLPWNPIYPAVTAMHLGAFATAACRPDLAASTVIGGALFAVYYVIFMLGLEWSAPGYISRVWNLGELTGVLIHGIPLEKRSCSALPSACIGVASMSI